MLGTPRRLVGGLLAVGTAVAVAGCGSDPTEDAAAPAEGWEFTDDRGVTVTLDEAPDRVAGLNDVVSSLWNYGVAPVATFGQTSAADDVAFEGKDLSDVALVGTSYGEIDLEALAAADPDLVVTTVYPTTSGGEIDPEGVPYGFQDLAQLEQVEQIAPVVVLGWTGSAADVIERTADLAVSVGADEDAIAAERADFDAAAAELTEAASSGVTVLPVAAYAGEGCYMAKAPDDPSLRMYADLGVQFLDPGGEEYYWQTAGWESVTDYRSDVILYSLRGAMSPEEMATQPTYGLLPAAQAGQVYPWEYIGMDYPAQAAYMERLAGWLADSEPVT
ncbi:ABC transporter substrate-binding protein [Klenkia brasiliensis]|uniref:Iron complex transport system substrate-binding protein n=1 Tax=Klenkia brasiliensis TaxID=333142 RepID=A0A1G7TDL1_9ACTN|nr:ABC transporter substrate-binding protein [Klenkia brasiliensis]SDG33325.1 iron complex transport system substrate-binding protein [Klenkia brasiliensis]